MMIHILHIPYISIQYANISTQSREESIYLKNNTLQDD